MKKTSKLVKQFLELKLLKDEEMYVGAFLGRSMPSVWWYFILGPLAAFMLKQYQVVVSSERIFFSKLSPLVRLSNFDAFDFSEVKVISCTKRLLSYRILFTFNNGRSLRLDSNFRGAARIDGFLLTPEVLSALQSLQK